MHFLHKEKHRQCFFDCTLQILPFFFFFSTNWGLVTALHPASNQHHSPKSICSLRVSVAFLRVIQSCPTLCYAWTIHSMEFSRPEYWSGSCFLLQWIFPTQESNQGLLHCRQILYQLSYQQSLVFCNSRYTSNFFIIIILAMMTYDQWSLLFYDCWPHGLCSPWNSPGQNIGVGSLSFLQGIFPIQELNWGLLHCRQILYQLSYQGSPRGHEPHP